MKNVIVSGATSFIGSKLVKKLVKEGYYVFAVVRPNSKNISRLTNIEKNCSFIELDFADYEQLPGLILEKPYAFYQLAWDGTRGAFRNDFALQESNYQNSMRAFKAAEEMKCDYFIGIGSQAEYGPNKGPKLVSEDIKENPNTQYGIFRNKVIHEIIDSKPTISYIWPRIFSAYGPGDWEGSMVQSSLKKMIANEDINLTEGKQLWNYVYIDDVINLLFLLLDHRCHSGIYNICSEDTRPLKDFLDIMASIADFKGNLNYGAIPYGPAGVVDLNPSFEKTKKATGYNKFEPFEEGIKKTLESLKGEK